MKRTCIMLIILSFFTFSLQAQKENISIKRGNRLYRQQKFDESQQQYRKALELSPDNPSANYNLGNAAFRKNSYEDAAKSYDAAASYANDANIKEKSFYNKGVAAVKQQKLEESISAWKDALKLDPSDEEARDNLEKALRAQKNKQQQQNKNEKKKDEKKQDKRDQQKQDQNQQSTPPKSRLSKQQVEQLLKALQQKEKDVQDKMNQNKTRSLSQPEKDW